MSFLKTTNILSIAAILFIASSCGRDSQSKNANEDSVSYYANPPGNISQEDLHRYYSGVSGFYDSMLLRRGFNGAILVAKNGRIIFEKYHGYFDLQKKDTLNEHSAFHLASVTKTFTAMAVLKLAENGKLNLEDDLKVFFPNFPYDGVTVRMLLNHRSGLPNYLYFMELLGWDKKIVCSNSDILDYMVKYKPDLARKPGTHFSYCNTNYILLALLIEKASGKTYAEYLQQIFFTPLKMNDTYVFSLADTQRAMPSYNWKGQLEPFTFLDI